MTWSHRQPIALLAAALLAAGCATSPSSPPPPAAAAATSAPAAAPVVPAPPPPPPPPPAPTAASELALGVKNYEDGDYKSATKYFHSALDMGLSAPSDQARAHKYLAFMVCVNGREKPCRDEFKKALETYPAFELAPAEAGHPVWPVVVKSVKAEIAREQRAEEAKKKAEDAKQKAAVPAKPAPKKTPPPT